VANIAYCFLLALTFAIPWENSIIIPGIGTIGRLIGLVTAAFGVLALVLRGRLRHPATFHYLSAVFVAWSMLTLMWTVDMPTTMERISRTVQGAALPWLVWELASSSGRRRGLLQAYVLGAYVSAVDTIGNYQAGISSHEATGRFTAEGFNPNDLGFLLVLALPMAWHLGISYRNPILRWLNRIYLPVGIVAILLTGSRSSLITAMLAMTIVPLTFTRLKFGMKAGVVAALAVAVIATIQVVPATTWQRLGTIGQEIESGTLNERRVIWEAGLQVFQRHPIGGIGAGAFAPAVVPFLGYAKTPHNSYISALVELGLVGFTIFILMLVSIFFHARGATDHDRRFVYVLLLTLVVGLLPRAWETYKPTWLMFGLLLLPVETSMMAAEPQAGRAPARPPRMRRAPVPPPATTR
jgi:O-antigen ligase